MPNLRDILVSTTTVVEMRSAKKTKNFRPLSGGGGGGEGAGEEAGEGGTIYSYGFFVQSNLADRYIHRKEMWVISLKSSSSIEFEIKMFFFPNSSYRGLNFRQFC